MNEPPKGYHRDSSFPNEAFVQRAIESHFASNGWEAFDAHPTDFACRRPATGECWHIEAKGKTTDVGLDFKTGLGQLLTRATNPDAKYGMAVPDTPDFHKVCKAVPSWVRFALSISWLFVSPEGAVRIVDPGQDL